MSDLKLKPFGDTYLGKSLGILLKTIAVILVMFAIIIPVFKFFSII